MKNHLAALAFLFITSAFAAGQSCDSLGFIPLQPRDFLEKFNNSSSALLIDVREPFEYKKSRISGAINLPSSGKIDLASDTMNRAKPCFLYCTSGFRSDRVAGRLAAKGFVQIYSLQGGISKWKKEGLPVSRKKVKNK